MNKKLINPVLSGLFAAIIFVMTYLIKVPVASGYVHLGDSLLYLCAAMVGGPWAMLSGAVGEALADIAGGYAIYAPATFIIKLFMALPFAFVVAKKPKMFSLQSVLFAVLGGVITVGGYFLADLIIDEAYAVADIVGNAIQAVVSIVFFAVLAAVFDKFEIKKRVLKK